MTLASIPLRTPVQIERIDGDRPYRRRLMELGFLPGVSVRVLGVAPFGDPLDVEIRGCRFSLRNAEASCIHVKSIAVPAGEAVGPQAAGGDEIHAGPVVELAAK